MPYSYDRRAAASFPLKEQELFDKGFEECKDKARQAMKQVQRLTKGRYQESHDTPTTMGREWHVLSDDGHGS